MKINENYTEKELYSRLRKYIPRSMAGDTYAGDMVSKLADVADKYNFDIFEHALADSLSEITAFDNFALGVSLNNVIRTAYTPSDDLDEFFDLYREPKLKGSKTPFRDFCTLNGLNHDDLMLLPITGDSMTGAGIYDGDTAIVDVGKIPKNGDIGAVSAHNKYYIKKIGGKGGRVVLLSENPDYQPYIVTPYDNFKFIGLVTNIIKKVQK